MDFDAVGEVRFREGKCRPKGWSTFEVAEEVELLPVVAVVWIFSFRENERYCLFDVMPEWEYKDEFSIDSSEFSAGCR